MEVKTEVRVQFIFRYELYKLDLEKVSLTSALESSVSKIQDNVVHSNMTQRDFEDKTKND